MRVGGLLICRCMLSLVSITITKHLSLRDVSVSKLVEMLCVKWGLWYGVIPGWERERSNREGRGCCREGTTYTHAQMYKLINGDLHHTEWGGEGACAPKHAASTALAHVRHLFAIAGISWVLGSGEPASDWAGTQGEGSTPRRRSSLTSRDLLLVLTVVVFCTYKMF